MSIKNSIARSLHINIFLSLCMISIYSFAKPIIDASKETTLLEEQSNFHSFMKKYCLKFKQTSDDYIVDLIEDMEASPFKLEEYLTSSTCQAEGYSNAVKSPMLHMVADDPNAREDFLQSFYRYFLVKRKQPNIFSIVLNTKNTKGETLLDYFHSLDLSGTNQRTEQKAVVQELVKFSCEHGATYLFYKQMKCP